MTTIPSIAQLKSNFISDFQGEYGVTLNPFGQSFLEALATVVGGIVWLLYLFIAAVQGNVWPDTCDYPTLLRFGFRILGRNPYAAIPGQYTCTVTGTMGAVIPGSTVFQADSNSQNPNALFQIVGGPYTMPGASGTITVQALAGGTATAEAVGNTMTSVSPILNVNSQITIATVSVIAVDAETEAIYRQNVLDRILLQAGSWSAADYRLLGTGINGVAQTYAYLDPADTDFVDVYLQGPVAGTPVSGAVISAYQAAIDLDRPIGVLNVNVAACPQNVIGVTIAMGAFAAFTPAQQTLISEALVAFINSVHPFIPACDTVVGRNDVIAIFNLNTVIGNAVPGFGFSAVTFTVDTVPTTTYQCGLNGIGNVPFFSGGVIYA